jgi:ATP-dependent DNA helicase PIF1
MEVMENIIDAKPRTQQQLQAVKGVGPKMMSEIGSQLLALCKSSAPAPPPAMPPKQASNKRACGAMPSASAAPQHRQFASLSGTLGSTSSSSSGPPATPPIEAPSAEALNAEQRDAAARALDGANMFLTGAAGVGKSFLLKHVVSELERRHPGGVVVTASTGIAASHIGGGTIHSFAGIGLGKGGRQKLVEKVLGNSAAVGRWESVAVLVLDEVSMLDSELFAALEAIARAARRSSRPFGGVQLFLSGDFFQLPPVSLGQYGAGFAFESPAWAQCGITTVVLRTVVRQSGDTRFIGLLNEIRVGRCSDESSKVLGACHVSRKPVPKDGVLPTKLCVTCVLEPNLSHRCIVRRMSLHRYCKNQNVDEENNTHLARLPGDARTFDAIDAFRGGQPSDPRQLMASVEKKAPQRLCLKLGAQVILTRNMPEHKLVNGSRGAVVGFVEAHCVEYIGAAAGNYLCPQVHSIA